MKPIPPRIAALSVAGMVLAALGGCLSRPPIVKQSFLFDVPASAEKTSESAVGVLFLRTLAVAAPFDGRSFVYRTGAQSYELDPYAEFLIPPARSLSDSLRAQLRNTGVLRDVLEPGSVLKPDALAEIYVTELCGDFRQPGEAAAVLRLRILYFDAAGALQWEKEFVRHARVKERTAPAVMAGWNEALGQISGEIVETIKTKKTTSHR